MKEITEVALPANVNSVVACYPFVLQVKNSMYRDATLTSAKVGFYWKESAAHLKEWKVRDIEYEFQPPKDGRSLIVEADLSDPMTHRAFGSYKPAPTPEDRRDAAPPQPLDLSGVTRDALDVLKIAQTRGFSGGIEGLCWLELVSWKTGPVWNVHVYTETDIGGHKVIGSKMVARIDARSGDVLDDHILRP